jgi:ribonuclease HII
MTELAEEFPQYKWEKNKGYGTKEHIEAIREHGRCKYHRKSFKIKGLDDIEE